VLALIVFIASGCVGTRLGVSWPAIRVIDDTQNILLAYNDQMLIVEPISGELIPLVDAQGDPRTDSDGNPRYWQLRAGDQGLAGGQFFGSPLLLDDDRLLAADHTNNKLVEVDLNAARIDNPTGRPTEGKVLADLVSDGERVFLPFETHDLQALDLETFELEWSFDTEDNGVWSPPLLHDGVLYFAAMDQGLYAVDPETGEQRWRFDLTGAGASTPALYNETLYAGSFNRKVFAVSLDGEQIADYDTENWVWGAPVVADDVVYVADVGGFVYALDAADLSEIWKIQTASTRGFRPAPLVTEDYVIVASREGYVYWLNRADGAEVYRREVNAEILSDILLVTPTISVNGEDVPQPTVVVSTVALDRLLLAFDLIDASPKWTYPKSG
jgi:outer membrane protein assembly factor BamB